MGETGRFCRISPFFPCAGRGDVLEYSSSFEKIQEADYGKFTRRNFELQCILNTNVFKPSTQE